MGINFLMKKFNSLKFAVRGSGLRAGVAHLAAVLIGDPTYFRPSSLHDIRRSDAFFATQPEEFLRFLFPEISETEISEAISFGESNVRNQEKFNAPARQPMSWNSGYLLQMLTSASIYILRPDIIVETGTANGISTRALAGAVTKVDKGRVWTVDVLENVGSLIPAEHLGVINFVHYNGNVSMLPEALDFDEFSLRNSIFLHDADHSYSGQFNDYAIAKTLGFEYLFSDDVDASFAFLDFPVGRKAVIVDGDKVIGAGRLW
jgi:hypothetical protein